MATNLEVLNYLRPDGGLIQSGEDYAGIEFIEAKPFTKKQYEDAFAQVDLEKEKKANAKAALLERLGITEEEAKLLLG